MEGIMGNIEVTDPRRDPDRERMGSLPQAGKGGFGSPAGGPEKTKTEGKLSARSIW
jgi:hypothetical protein